MTAQEIADKLIAEMKSRRYGTELTLDHIRALVNVIAPNEKFPMTAMVLALSEIRKGSDFKYIVRAKTDMGVIDFSCLLSVPDGLTADDVEIIYKRM